jgi:hypothetical protein
LITEIRHCTIVISKCLTLKFNYHNVDGKAQPAITKLVGSMGRDVEKHHETLPNSFPSIPYENPPTNPVSIYYPKSPFVNNVASTIRQALHEEAICLTICKQEKWDKSQLQMVDWQAMEAAFHQTWSCKRLSFTKLSHKLLNTNAQNHKFYGKPATCPCRRHAAETLEHVFTCSSSEVVDYRSKQKQILWHALSLLNTPDDIVVAIKRGLQVVGEEPPNSLSQIPLPPNAMMAYDAQTSLGWSAFLRGRISVEWRAALTSSY